LQNSVLKKPKEKEEQMENLVDKKLTWEKPDVTVYGDLASLTQGSPQGTGKNLGFGDDILQVVNAGISSVP